MGYCFVISRRYKFAEELGKYLVENTSIQPVRIDIKSPDDSDTISIFNSICDKIQTYPAKFLCKSRVIIDEVVQWKEFDPLKETSSYGESLFAMLILAFPELQFTFLNHTGPFKDKPPSHYNFNAWFDQINKETSYTPLFDPDGLRNQIRNNIQRNNDVPTELAMRNRLVAAIDDEPEYAWFEAYTAYRFGYRGHTVTSFSLFEELFNEKSNFEVETLFDDLFLNFPDRSPGTSLSNLEEREKEKNFPKLSGAKHHIVITTGHNKGDNRKTWIKNRQHLFKKRMKGNKSEILHKPFAGIFDLWKQSNLERWLKGNKGLAKGFEWPPDTSKQRFDDSNIGHSAPGRLLAVAEKLIERSRSMLNGVDSVQKAVHGAMLALEARELLGNRTPTTSLEALSLKHQFEVKAECMFYGVEYHFDVDARIADIKKEIDSISYWFNQKEKRRSELNAEIGILNKLSSIYRQHGQFDEENRVMDEMRKLHTRLWSARKPVRWALYPIRRYIEILMSSMTKFTLAILVWILLFSSVFYLQFRDIDGFGFGDSLAVSTTTFLGFQPPDIDFWGMEYSKVEKLATKIPETSQFWFVMPAVLGFVHLGIFISHLYLIISRRAGP